MGKVLTSPFFVLINKKILTEYIIFEYAKHETNFQ
jgi:hypothetical protein